MRQNKKLVNDLMAECLGIFESVTGYKFTRKFYWENLKNDDDTYGDYSSVIFGDTIELCFHRIRLCFHLHYDYYHLKGTILHEIIHAWQEENLIEWNHGDEFLTIASKLINAGYEKGLLTSECDLKRFAEIHWGKVA